MASKIVKEERINQVVELLEKGLKSGEICKICTKKFGVSSRQIDKYIAAAKPIVTARAERRGEIITAKEREVIEAHAESHIMTVLEKQEILTKIARGELITNKILGYELVPEVNQVIDEDGDLDKQKEIKPHIIMAPIAPSISERMAAISEHNKMHGHYSPEKKRIDVTTQGESLHQPVDLSTMSAEQIKKLLDESE